MFNLNGRELRNNINILYAASVVFNAPKMLNFQK
jgi:hypothetical protein